MNFRSTRTAPKTRRPRSRRSLASHRGVALVILMIFLSLMLLLGLAITQLTTTEVSVGRNVNLAAEAFSVADSGAAHAYELVRHMRGDFTALLRGDDDTLHSGDEFADRDYKVYNLAGAVVATGPERMFDLTKVRAIPNTGTRALVRVDGRHFYELIPYDNARDPKAYLYDARFEDAVDGGHHANIDGDQRVLIRSIGYVMPQETNLAGFDPRDALASAVVDVVIGLTPYPAVVSNGDLTITNTVTITGQLGGVHANDDLVLDAGGFDIQQSATFSDSDGTTPSGANQTADNPQVAGFNGSADPLKIPDLNPYTEAIARKADLIYLTPSAGPALRAVLLAKLGGDALAEVSAADPGGVEAVVLGSDHAATPNYTVLFHGPSSNGVYDNVGVDVPAAGPVNVFQVPSAGSGKTIFVLMPQGSPDRVTIGGGLIGQISVITNGSVGVATDSNLSSALRLSLDDYPPWYWMDMLVIAGEDLVVDGPGGVGRQLQGVLYAHEQFDVAGSGTIVGQVVSYEREIEPGTYVSSTTVTSYPSSAIGPNLSVVRGNLQVAHEPGRGYMGNFAIASWRQLRDFDPVNAPR